MIKVTYNANGDDDGDGTVPMTELATAGSNVTLAGPGSLTRTGYTFSGWNIVGSGVGTTYPAGALLVVNENINLSAKWTIAPVPDNLSLDNNVILQGRRDNEAALVAVVGGTGTLMLWRRCIWRRYCH